jgi:hypothetical protein
MSVSSFSMKTTTGLVPAFVSPRKDGGLVPLAKEVPVIRPEDVFISSCPRDEGRSSSSSPLILFGEGTDDEARSLLSTVSSAVSETLILGTERTQGDTVVPLL